MTAPFRPYGPPQGDVHHRPTPQDRVPARQGSAGLVVASFAASVAALLTAPLLLVPVACLLPPGLAAAGVWTSTKALRRPTGSAWPGVALTVAVLVLAVTGATALLWTFSVVNPAVTQYTELHEVLRAAVDRIL